MKKSVCFILLMCFIGTGATGSTGTTKATSWYWEKGLHAARNKQADSALFFLKKAFSRGIADDSLYYLWAEIYLNKGILDTALVLNLSIEPKSGQAVRTIMLEQRYLIYTTLGWEKEAKECLDSTVAFSAGKTVHWYIPECVAYISAGAYVEQNVEDNNYPFPRLSDSSETIKNGNALVSLRLGWPLLKWKGSALSTGIRIRYSGSRFSLSARNTQRKDSADALIGAYLKYLVLSRKLSFRYRISRKEDYLDRLSTVHLFTTRYILYGKQWFGSLEGGYQYEYPEDETYYYMVGWYNRDVGKKSDISAELFLSGFSGPLLNFNIQRYPIFYVKNGFAYWSAIYEPQYIIDTKLTLDMIDTLGFIDSTTFFHSIGQSYMSVAPSLGLECTVGKKWSLGGKCAYSWTWYHDRYRWLDFGYSADTLIPETNILDPYYPNVLAVDVDNGGYRWIRNVNYIASSGTAVLDSINVRSYTIRRIDQVISMNFFLKRSFGTFGDGMIDVTLRRHFSTLQKSAPIDIQKWYGEMMFTWFFRYKPRERLYW